MNNKYRFSIWSSIVIAVLISAITFSIVSCGESDAYKGIFDLMGIWGIVVIVVIILVIPIIVYLVFYVVEHLIRRASQPKLKKEIIQDANSNLKKQPYVNPNLKEYPYFECRDCGASFEIDPKKAEATIYVCCPNCNKKLLAWSDYGFGPVWPAQIYHGSEIILNISDSGDLKIIDKNHKRVKMDIPYRLLKNDYANHMKICEYVFKTYINKK